MTLRTDGLRITPTMQFITDDNPLLTVPVIKQDKGEWCWAACAVMVLRHYGDANTKQCHLVQPFYSGTGKDCCDLLSPSLCNSPCHVDDIRGIFIREGISCSAPISGPVPFDKVQEEIAAKRPVEVFLSGDRTGHFIIIRGWYISGTHHKVLIVDPISGADKSIDYNHLVKGYSDKRWKYTWIRLRR